MASGKSHYLENAVLNAALINTALNTGTTLYVALTTASPTAASTGVTIAEPSDANYVRVSVGNAWAAPVNGATSNTGSLTGFFGAGAATGASITSIAIVDNATKSLGNLLYWGDITGGPKTINAGDTASIAASAISITET